MISTRAYRFSRRFIGPDHLTYPAYSPFEWCCRFGYQYHPNDVTLVTFDEWFNSLEKDFVLLETPLPPYPEWETLPSVPPHPVYGLIQEVKELPGMDVTGLESVPEKDLLHVMVRRHTGPLYALTLQEKNTEELDAKQKQEFQAKVAYGVAFIKGVYENYVELCEVYNQKKYEHENVKIVNARIQLERDKIDRQADIRDAMYQKLVDICNAVRNGQFEIQKDFTRIQAILRKFPISQEETQLAVKFSEVLDSFPGTILIPEYQALNAYLNSKNPPPQEMVRLFISYPLSITPKEAQEELEIPSYMLVQKQTNQTTRVLDFLEPVFFQAFMDRPPLPDPLQYIRDAPEKPGDLNEIWSALYPGGIPKLYKSLNVRTENYLPKEHPFYELDSTLNPDDVMDAEIAKRPDQEQQIRDSYPFRTGIILVLDQTFYDNAHKDFPSRKLEVDEAIKRTEEYRVKLEAYHQYYYSALFEIDRTSDFFHKLWLLYVYRQITSSRSEILSKHVAIAKWADVASIKVAATRAKT